MKVTCMVDDAVDGRSLYWGEHGVSFFIETSRGRVLFDSGQSGTVLLHNLRLAAIDPKSIDAIIISHAHLDHTGGLEALLAQTGVKPLYAHPDLFRERFAQHDGQIKKIGPAMSLEQLQRLAELRLSQQPQEILPGVYTSGEITVRAEPEGRSPRHMIREGSGWVADPYRDDMAIVLAVADGPVLACGCCHAGLLNMLQHVHSHFAAHAKAVVGGTHLADANDEQMLHILQVLRSYGPPKLYPNHCTGLRAYMALAVAFGSHVAPCPAGTVLTF